MKEGLDRISKLLSSWNPLFLSWWGCLDSINMMITPFLMYIFSMIPIHIPFIYFKKMDSLLSKCLWNNKKSRFSLSQLRKPKSNGGVNFPNFRLYNKAFCLMASCWLLPLNTFMGHHWTFPTCTFLCKGSSCLYYKGKYYFPPTVQTYLFSIKASLPVEDHF